MIEILTKLGIMFGITCIIGFFVALIMRLIILGIKNMDKIKSPADLIKKYRRMRKIHKLKMKRLFKEFKKKNTDIEIINYYYGKD